MGQRDAEIQDLIDCLAVAVHGPGQPALPTGADISRLFERLQSCCKPCLEGAGNDLPILSLLPVAVKTAQAGSGPAAAVARAFATLAPRLRWYVRAEQNLVEFTNGHANAEIIGTRGLEARDDITIGVSLLAPNVQYPEHRHPPEEVYIVLSEGEWCQNNGPWQAPGIGGLVYNPSNTLHAMRASSAPLLALWCLWPK